MSLFAIILLIAVVIFISKGVIVVRQAEVLIIERLGSYSRTLSNGLNFIVPIVDAKRSMTWKKNRTGLDGVSRLVTSMETRIDLRETVYDFPKQNVITRDNVTIQINALLYFQLTDPVKAVYEINNLPEAIEKLTQTTLRNVLGDLELDETFVSRDTINTKLRAILDDATDKWGVKVNRVELQDIIPPKEIRESMEKQMKAERDKRAAILTAQGDKQSKILNAEGIRDSEIAQAEGSKRARILSAEGEREGIELVKSAIGEDKFVNYLIAQKYIQMLDELATKNTDKVVFMPIETTGVLGSIGSIKELWKEGNEKNSLFKD